MHGFSALFSLEWGDERGAFCKIWRRILRLLVSECYDLVGWPDCGFMALHVHKLLSMLPYLPNKCLQRIINAMCTIIAEKAVTLPL